MFSHYSRAEKRELRYQELQDKGLRSTVDVLYGSEIKKLRKLGYIVNPKTSLEVRKNLTLCEVIFPQC